MVNLLIPKLKPSIILGIIIVPFTLSVFPLFIDYKYLEISLSLLLIIFLIIGVKTEKGIIVDAFCIFLLGFLLHSVYFCAQHMEENRLFNLGIVFISVSWIIVFNRYFKLEEEERLLPLVSFFERRRF